MLPYTYNMQDPVQHHSRICKKQECTALKELHEAPTCRQLRL